MPQLPASHLPSGCGHCLLCHLHALQLLSLLLVRELLPHLCLRGLSLSLPLPPASPLLPVMPTLRAASPRLRLPTSGDADRHIWHEHQLSGPGEGPSIPWTRCLSRSRPAMKCLLTAAFGPSRSCPRSRRTSRKFSSSWRLAACPFANLRGYQAKASDAGHVCRQI